MVSREIGVARGGGRNFALSEHNAALMFPRSSRTFGKMLREDAKVKATFRAVTLPIRRANWMLNPNGADSDVVAHVAEDLRLKVKGDDPHKPLSPTRGRVSWDKHLEHALYALAFGHMFFEQVYRVGDDGREHLHKLAPRWPGTLSQINVEKDGGLKSVSQVGSGLDSHAEIPVSRLVAYVFDDVGSQWTGTSIFRPAYKHWVLKNELLEKEVQTLDRNGMGVPVYTGSELAVNPNEDLRYGQELVEGIRSGAHAGATIPTGARLEFKGVSGQIVSPREAISYHDAEIANSVLANFLNLAGGGGSYALADTQSDFFNQSEQTVADWVADTANQFIVEDLVRVVFPDYEGPCPRVSFDAIGSRKELTPQDLRALIDAGLIMTDKPTEEWARDLYAMPAKQTLSDALEGKKERQRLEEQMGVTLKDGDAPDESVDAAVQAKVERMMNALRGKDGD